MSSFFRDGPEYEKRRRTPFTPSNVSLAQLNAVIPDDLRRKSTIKALAYIVRDVFVTIAFYQFGARIDPTFGDDQHGVWLNIAKWLAWSFYWYWQGVMFACFFTLGHEAGHGTLSPFPWVNEIIGFIAHTAIFIPYHAWRSSHHAHHKAIMSLELDQNYIPPTRTTIGLPPKHVAERIDYLELLEETPVYTLFRLAIMQLCGWPAYLLWNLKGSPRYEGKVTNHFLPSSPLFRPKDRRNIIISDLGLLAMGYLLHYWTSLVGVDAFLKLYLVPYIVGNHWLVMFSYLQHVDPTVPIYRRSQWTFVRGALSTIDRPFLGWVGRVFFHNASHDHLAHHLFSSVPFYNLPAVTERIKPVLKDDYNYDSTNTFRALYRTFRDCTFVEDDGDILFYKNNQGKAARILHQE